MRYIQRMVKVVFGRLTRRPPKSPIPTKKVRNGDGEIVVLRTLDASSAAFGANLEQVFRGNVARARRRQRAMGIGGAVPKE
jgi:hypothetical protein